MPVPGPTMIIGVSRPAAGGSAATRCRNTAPAAVGAVGQEGRAHPAARAAVGAVAHHRHGQLDLVRADQRARRDRVLPRRQPHQHLLPLARVGPHARTRATTSRPLRSTSHLSSSPRRCQRLGGCAVRAVLGDEIQQVRRDLADVVGRRQRVAQRHVAPSTMTASSPLKSGRGEPGVHRVLGVDHVRHPASRRPSRSTSCVADVEPELAHLLGAPVRGQPGVAAPAARAPGVARVNGAASALGTRLARRRCSATRPANRSARAAAVRPLRPAARRRRPRTRRGRAAGWHRGPPAGRPATWRGRRSCRRTGRRCRAPRTARPSSAGASGDSSRSQKSAPLSGGPPSPNVLVTIDDLARRRRDRSRSTSSMPAAGTRTEPSRPRGRRTPRRCRSAMPTAPAARVPRRRGGPVLRRE